MRHIKQRNVTRKDRRSEVKAKSRSQCPADLADYIEFANIADPRMDIVHYTTVWPEFICQFTDEDTGGFISVPFMCGEEPVLDSDVSSALRACFDRCFQGFPVEIMERWMQANRVNAALEIQNWELSRSDSDPRMEDLAIVYTLDRLIHLDEYRETLRQIAWYFEGIREAQLPRRLTRSGESYFLPTFDSQLTESDNVISIEGLDMFARAVIGVNSDRIRICEICGHLFWARRKEAETDYSQCANRAQLVSRSRSQSLSIFFPSVRLLAFRSFDTRFPASWTKRMRA